MFDSGKGMSKGKRVPGRRNRVCKGLKTWESDTKPWGAGIHPGELQHLIAQRETLQRKLKRLAQAGSSKTQVYGT